VQLRVGRLDSPCSWSLALAVFAEIWAPSMAFSVPVLQQLALAVVGHAEPLQWDPHRRVSPAMSVFTMG
jgi:hypothetical protein